MNFFWKILFCLLLYPQLCFGLSENELESLESSGSKSFSKSAWRTQMSFSLLRNLLIETRHTALSQKDTQTAQQGALNDLSDLYYRYNVGVYYSLNKILKDQKVFNFLKQTELFAVSSFTSNFAEGACSLLEKYRNKTTDRITVRNYIRCGLGDITGGFTTPVFSKKKFFSFFDFSMLLYPLSKNSQDVSLYTYVSGGLRLLYFLKKQNHSSWMLSSFHNLSYNHFKYKEASSRTYNSPLGSNQSLAIIFNQQKYKYLPASTQLFSSYSLTFNYFNTDSKDCKNQISPTLACGTRTHSLSLGANSSWKLLERTYLGLNLSWRDALFVSNPLDSKVGLSQAHSFGLHKWFFSIKGSYTF